MKTIITILILMFLLPGCSFAQPKSKIIFERIKIVPPEPKKEKVKIQQFNDISTITWIKFTDIKKLRQACYDIGLIPWPNWHINACAEVTLKTKTCTIYAMVPKYLGDRWMESLGHETLHCFAGQFHSSEGTWGQPELNNGTHK